MKRISILLSLLLFVAVSSCEKAQFSQKLLIGTWLETEAEIYMNGVDAPPSKVVLPDDDRYFVFESNGKGSRFYSKDPREEFTYDFNDVTGKLIVRFEDGQGISYKVEELTTELLVLSSKTILNSSGKVRSVPQHEYFTKSR